MKSVLKNARDSNKTNKDVEMEILIFYEIDFEI